MAHPAGFEPVTSASGGLNQQTYVVPADRQGCFISGEEPFDTSITANDG